MKELRTHLMQFLAIAILIAMTLSCKLSTTAPEGENMPTPVNTDFVQEDIKKLAKLINLPIQPESVLWRITKQGFENPRTVPGPSDYTLEAILSFSPEDSQEIQTMSSTYVLDWTVEWEESYFETWYPDSVKQSFTLDTATEKYKLNGSVYNASEMFGKSPYLTGSFFVTNAGEVFLSVSSN